MEARRAIGIACASLTAALLAAATPAASAELDAAQTEELVRTLWYEGLPFEEAAKIGPEGAAALVALLADPSESAVHANALLALGISGQPGAYEAIDAWARAPRDGEVDRSVFRAWQTLPHALGHLARRDPRALDALAARLAPAAVSWRFRHFDAARLREMERRGVASALGSSGLSLARALLAGARAAGGPGWRSHVDEALALQARVAAQGPAGVFDSKVREGVR